MKKQTTRQRVEQAVERALLFAAGNRKELPLGEVEFLMRQEILAERRRIRREVGRLRKGNHYRAALKDLAGMAYEQACDDILARLRG